MASKRPTPKLSSIDELLLLSEESKVPETVTGTGVTQLLLSDLVPFHNHPFKLYEGNKLDELVESVMENGVLIPIIVRPKEPNGYVILSGHNRVNAAKAAGLISVPSIIMDNLTEAEAVIIVVDTNFHQRSIQDMLPSELARALHMQLKACKEAKQKQNKLNQLEKGENSSHSSASEASVPVGQGAWSVIEVSEKNDMSPTNIKRYLRLNHLVPELLERVDQGEIKLRPAVDLSYLKPEEQQTVETLIQEQGYKVDMKKSELLRGKSENRHCTEQVVKAILSGEATRRPKSKTPAPFKLKHKIYTKYFSPDSKAAEVEEIIDKALTLYFSQHPKENHDPDKEVFQ
ncbi:ParB N-terminal domain-containing protein [Paenibacillus sp. J22TS3]|uniref:ParB N-terminal domain-containing protein n=1 Tax=Paenibacillus sp. J22TS3 TaxID=2807192 RepID=UPI001B115394|nr:ParB N-terminal domain-containing protein [Paenibacillus sp. J22TS3]GIP20837.1 chromosome partitioning protein ParB [Paenibacillus sp. J22TS3]